MDIDFIDSEGNKHYLLKRPDGCWVEDSVSATADDIIHLLDQNDDVRKVVLSALGAGFPTGRVPLSERT